MALLAATASAAAGCFLFPNTLPIAEIDAHPTQGLAPLTVEFDASESFDPDGSIRRHEWNFGDGHKDTGRQVEHTYTTAEAYTATLTVTDKRGGRATASVTITVRGTNELPVAAFAAYPSPAYPGQSVQFTANASYDPDGQIVSYQWSFGDGTTGVGVNASHTYSTVGTYTVTLALRDNDGGERSATTDIQIANTIDASGTVSRHYEWEYNGKQESCDLDISLDLYRYYKSKLRIAFVQRDYDEYVLDPLDDEYLEEVTAEIVRNSAEYHEQLENALFFVQNCIVYVYDPRWYEYPRYPVEMLVDKIGDCEDTAILYTSLVRTLGHGALMAAVDTDHNGVADHMIAWVPVQPSFVAAHPDRSFWQYGGKTYAFAETAVEGGYVPLGVDPWGLTPDDIDTVYDVSGVDRSPQAVRVVSP
ncbi:MAG: PKD domain-containing protein [Candidatus Bipolaricaulis sp.]|nr:PKD domain-containing protein [Candidatus Bipolaricaulis sp.]